MKIRKKAILAAAGAVITAGGGVYMAVRPVPKAAVALVEPCDSEGPLPCPEGQVRVYGCVAAPNRTTAICWSGDDYTTRVSLVFDPNHCPLPRSLWLCSAGRCRTRDEFASYLPWFLDWHGPYIPGDVVQNGVIDVDDLQAVIEAFQACPDSVLYDVCPLGGGDGVIDLDDIQGVISAFQGFEPCLITE